MISLPAPGFQQHCLEITRYCSIQLPRRTLLDAPNGGKHLLEVRLQTVGIAARKQENIGGLEVSVNRAALVGSLDSFGDANHQLNRCSTIDRAITHLLVKWDPLDQRHGKECLAKTCLGELDDRHDIRMVQHCCDRGLPSKRSRSASLFGRPWLSSLSATSRRGLGCKAL